MSANMLRVEVLDGIEELKSELEALTTKLSDFKVDIFDEVESIAEKSSIKIRAEQIQSILRALATLRDVESQLEACEEQFTNTDENVVARAKAFYKDFEEIKTGMENSLNELFTESSLASE